MSKSESGQIKFARIMHAMTTSWDCDANCDKCPMNLGSNHIYASRCACTYIRDEVGKILRPKHPNIWEFF